MIVFKLLTIILTLYSLGLTCLSSLYIAKLLWELRGPELSEFDVLIKFPILLFSKEGREKIYQAIYTK